MSLKLSDTRVYEPQIRARLGTPEGQIALMRLMEGQPPHGLMERQPPAQVVVGGNDDAPFSPHPRCRVSVVPLKVYM